MADRFCSHCGTEVEEEARFCPTCGRTLDQPPDDLSDEGEGPMEEPPAAEEFRDDQPTAPLRRAAEPEAPDAAEPIPPAPAWPPPPEPEPAPEPEPEPEPPSSSEPEPAPAPEPEPTRSQSAAPPPPPAPAGPWSTPTAAGKGQLDPFTVPTTLGGWLIGAGSGLGALALLPRLGLVLNVFVFLALLWVAATVFLADRMPSFGRQRLAILVVVMIAVGVALERSAFTINGVDSIFLITMLAAAGGVLLVELDRDRTVSTGGGQS